MLLDRFRLLEHVYTGLFVVFHHRFILSVTLLLIGIYLTAEVIGNQNTGNLIVAIATQPCAVYQDYSQ